MDHTLWPEFEKATSRPHFVLFRDGEAHETIEGINAPLLEKLIADTIPEGVLDLDDAAGGGGDEEED